MFAMTLVFFVAMQAPVPDAMPASPAVKEKRVPVEGSFLLVPRLPTGIPDARKGHAPVEEQAKVALDYLDHVLADLYRLQPSGSEVRAGSLRVPKEDSERIKSILLVMQDPTFKKLEEEVMARREAWAKDMQTGRPIASNAPAVAEPTKKPELENLKPDQSRSALDERIRRIAEARAIVVGTASEDNKAYWGALPRYKVKIGPILYTLEPASENYRSSILTMDQEMERDATTRRAVGQLTDEHLNRLGEAFDRLRLHLDEAFLASATLVKTPGATLSEPCQSLQRALQILLLERLRNALWFSWQVWADVASKPLPPPLARLVPEAQTAPSGQPN